MALQWVCHCTSLVNERGYKMLPTKPLASKTEQKCIRYDKTERMSDINGLNLGTPYMYCSVPHIRPRFATLALVESVGRPYIQDPTFYLAITPPFSSAMPRCLHGNINILQTDRSWFNICLPSLLASSRNSNTLWSRLTDRGWPQRGQQRFPSTPRVCPFKVL